MDVSRDVGREGVDVLAEFVRGMLRDLFSLAMSRTLVSREPRGALTTLLMPSRWRARHSASRQVSVDARRFHDLLSCVPSVVRAESSRAAVRLIVLTAAAGALFASFGITKAIAIGVEPGTFSYKLHESVPLLKPDGWAPGVADAKKLLTMPPITQAGAYADATVTWVLKVPGGEAAVRSGSEVTSDIVVKGPPGLLTNLNAVPPCSLGAFKYTVNVIPERSCPQASQVGVVSALFGGVIRDRTEPIFRLSTLPGALATFGYPYDIGLGRIGVFVNAKLRTNEDYGITLERTGTKIPDFVPASFMTFWGIPADSSHDSERWNRAAFIWGASAGAPLIPMVANATDCNPQVTEATLRLRYLHEPEYWLPDDPEDPSYRFVSPGPIGCDKLTFHPYADLTTSTNFFDSPSGISLHLAFPRATDSSGLESPPLKDGEITLPVGISINSAAANGVTGCDPEQIGFLGANFPAPNPIRFSFGVANCPDASKVGTAVMRSPLVEEPITGDIYLATPHDNPFHSLFALYLVFNGPGASDLDPNFTIKLAAQVAVDPVTGQISVKANSLPQLPSEDIWMTLFGGPTAPLATPPVCNEEAAKVRLVPWSTPESGPPPVLESRMAFHTGPSGDPCPQSSATRPFSPTLAVRTRNASASAPSPVVLHIGNPRGDQELGAFNIKFPRGLTANIREVAYCGPAGIAQAVGRNGVGEGTVEQTHPSCPADAKVGSLVADVGAGSVPLSVGGSVYLAGPYKGAPFSLVAVTPVLAGGTNDQPLFDLGTIVDRAAVNVDPRSGQITARADQMPRMLDGIPLRINSLTIRLDRQGFIRNPSSCNEKRTIAEVDSADGAQSMLSTRFQVGDCTALGFRPRAQVKLLGGTRQDQHPKLQAVLDVDENDATLARARVILPKAESLSHDRLANVCADTLLAQRSCPKWSVVGSAVAWSPFVGRPFEGRIYLTSAGRGRPGLALSLEGEVLVEATAELRVRRDHRTELVFTNLPDLPLERIKMTLQGGKRGLLTNSRDLCIRPIHFGLRFTSHSGRIASRRAYDAGKCSGG